MNTVIGVVIGVICVMAGYVLHGGHMIIFAQAWTEFIVIIGGAFGIFFGSNGPVVLQRTIADILGLLKPDPYTKKEFLNLLTMLYQMFNTARRDGLLAMEEHVENPHKSSIASKNPVFLHSHHACGFFCDTMRVVMNGGVAPTDLSDMMECDLDTFHKEHHIVPEAVSAAADAMPAVGIVACVLGVMITMGKIGGDAKELGHSIAVALVGTMLGIFLSYIVVTPVAKALGARGRGEAMYLDCIKHALLSFARGESPLTCVEFARRNIDPGLRPSFAEMEKAFKAAK